ACSVGIGSACGAYDGRVAAPRTLHAARCTLHGPSGGRDIPMQRSTRWSPLLVTLRWAGIAFSQPTAGSFQAPDTVPIHQPIPYAGPTTPRQTLCLLLPMKPRGTRPQPVIAYIHGGVWMSGDKSGALRRLADFVAHGDYAGATIGYRLTGEAIWPAQIYDCKA